MRADFHQPIVSNYGDFAIFLLPIFAAEKILRDYQP